MMIEGVPDGVLPAGLDWLVMSSVIGVVALVRESAMGWETLVPAARAAQAAAAARLRDAG